MGWENGCNAIYDCAPILDARRAARSLRQASSLPPGRPKGGLLASGRGIRRAQLCARVQAGCDEPALREHRERGVVISHATINSQVRPDRARQCLADEPPANAPPPGRANFLQIVLAVF